MPYQALAIGLDTASEATSKGRSTTANAWRALSMMALLLRRSSVINSKDVKMSSTTTRRRLNLDSMDDSRGLVVAAERHQSAHRIDVLESPPRTDHHTEQWVVGDLDRHACFVSEPSVDTSQQRTATRDHDALFHDVGGQLGWCLVERRLHCVDDCGQRLGQRFANLLSRERNGPRQPADQIAAADVGGQLFVERPRRSHVDLDLFGGAITDGERELFLDVLHDRVVELVAGDAH